MPHGKNPPKGPPEAGLKALCHEEVFRERLRKALPYCAEVLFTDNRRHLVTVKRNRDGSLTVRLQHAFRAAEGPAFHALAAFIQKPDNESRDAISAFVEKHRELFAALSPVPESAPARPIVCRPRGRHRDLEKILAKVLSDYNMTVNGLYITWGNDPKARLPLAEGLQETPGRRTKSRSIRFGSYSARHRIIRIHPLLDCLDIPEYFVEYIVYHEVLHDLCPPVSAGDRRSVHTLEFKARERMFARYRDARNFEQAWVKSHFLGGGR